MNKSKAREVLSEINAACKRQVDNSVEMFVKMEIGNIVEWVEDVTIEQIDELRRQIAQKREEVLSKDRYLLAEMDDRLLEHLSGRRPHGELMWEHIQWLAVQVHSDDNCTISQIESSFLSLSTSSVPINMIKFVD